LARLLIVNADDFGRSEGIDNGIMRAHREGIVTSTTFMTNAPSTPHAASLARGTPTLDLGVHLVLTYARPLSNPARIRSLVREDLKRAEQEKLEHLLLQGLEGGKPIVVKNIDEHFAKKKRMLLARMKSGSKASRR